jgi:hypothetical protein
VGDAEKEEEQEMQVYIYLLSVFLMEYRKLNGPFPHCNTDSRGASKKIKI